MAPNTAQMNPEDGMDRQARHEAADGMGRQVGRNPGAFVFASAIGPRIPLAPPDEGGSGGGDAGSADAGAGGDKPGADAGGDKGGSGEAQKPARPDYIPETFWDGDKGFKADDFNAIIARDAERSAELAQVPPSADKYEVKLPHDFKLDGLELKDGESPINPDDPRVAAARDFAHANKMSQSQFEGLVAMGVQIDVTEASRLQEALGKQVEALGAKGQDRVTAVKQWVSAKLPAKQAEAILGTLYTRDQIEGFEALMRMNRGVPGNPGAGRDSGNAELSDEEYEKMSPTERINYARQHSKK